MRRPPVRKAQPRPSAVVGDPVKTGDSARWRPHVIAVPFLLLLAVVVWRLQTPASVLDMNTDMHAICSIVAAFAAGLVYVHPVSAPAWGLAVWVMFVLGPGSV